jgi:hypothetical protein
MSEGLDDRASADAHHLVFQCMLQFWPRIAILAVIGGVAGLAVSSLRPACYLAHAELRVAVLDESYAVLDWDQRRILLAPLRSLLFEDSTLASTLVALEGTTMLHSVGELRERLRLSEIEDRVRLGALADDPELAAEIANTWAEVGLLRVERSQEAVREVALIQGELESAGCQRIVEAGGGDPLDWTCEGATNAAGAAASLDRLQGLTVDIPDLPPSLITTLVIRAAPPMTAVYGGRASMVLSGASLGFILGAGWILAEARRSSVPGI